MVGTITINDAATVIPEMRNDRPIAIINRSSVNNLAYHARVYPSGKTVFCQTVLMENKQT